MKRFFDPNNPVTGSSFLGRTRELAFLRDTLFSNAVQGNSVNLSITGMNRIGKTSLMKEACRRFREEDHPDVYLIESTLDGQSGFWRYWVGEVLRPLLKQIGPGEIDADCADLFEMCRAYFFDKEKLRALFQDDDLVADMEAKEQMDMLFFVLQRMQKHVILVIDEFDKASSVFGLREENFGWFRGLLQQNQNLSVVTLSRRSIYFIEQNSFGGSTLHGIFSKHGLFGFTNSEIQEFFDYVEIERGPLTDKQKKSIWYSCGRSPYYLAIIGDILLNNEKVNIAEACNCLCDSFDAVLRLLKEEGLLTAMLQMFVGPRFNLRQPEVERLMAMGYCMSKASLDTEYGIKEYIDLYVPERTGAYLTVCRRFEDYMAETFKGEIDDIWPKLTATQRHLKKLIEAKYKTLYGGNSENKLRQLLMTATREIFLNEHEQLYMQAGARQKKEVGNSILNVVNFTGLGIAMLCEWNSFKGCFSWSKDQFKQNIQILQNARNPIAHGNGELLTPEQVEEVEDVCAQFITKIDKVLPPEPVPAH